MSFTALPVVVASEVLTSFPTVPTEANTSSLPFWTKYSFTYTDFAVAALTTPVTAFTVAAKTVINQIVIKPTTAFAGTTTYTISAGISGTVTKYVAASDMKAAVSATLYYTVGASFIPTIENFSTSKAIILTATATVENLDQATQGAFDVYVLTSLLP